MAPSLVLTASCVRQFIPVSNGVCEEGMESVFGCALSLCLTQLLRPLPCLAGAGRSLEWSTIAWCPMIS